jgi:hypothetical protein
MHGSLYKAATDLPVIGSMGKPAIFMPIISPMLCMVVEKILS